MKLSAVVWPNKKVYFFKGAQYVRFDIAADDSDDGYPRPIAGNWKGFPTAWAQGIDAAVAWPNGKAFFFRGGEYLRFDIKADRVDAGYPKSIAGNWKGFPTTWTSGIDAAAVWPNGKAYFFKGNQYLRFDIKADHVDTGYPKPIAGNWKGFPSTWTTGVEAAFAYPNGTYAYFFKGSEYLRFDIQADQVSPPSFSFEAGLSTYPKPIAGNWSGVFGKKRPKRIYVDHMWCQTSSDSADDIYMVTFNGHWQEPFHSRVDTVGPGNFWDDFDDGEDWAQDIAITDYSPDSVVVVALIEKDANNDLTTNNGGSLDLVRSLAKTRWEATMTKLRALAAVHGKPWAPTAAELTTAAQDAVEALNAGLDTVLNPWPKGDDDQLGQPKRLSIAPGQTPQLHFAGDGGKYTVQFKVM